MVLDPIESAEQESEVMVMVRAVCVPPLVVPDAIAVPIAAPKNAAAAMLQPRVESNVSPASGEI